MVKTNRNHAKLDGQNAIVSAYNKNDDWFVSTDTYDELWNHTGYEFVTVHGKQNAIAESKRRGATLALETRKERKERVDNERN